MHGDSVIPPYTALALDIILSQQLQIDLVLFFHHNYITITVPEIVWIDRNITIPEGKYMELCFMSDIGTAVPYNIAIGVRAKGGNPASGNH